MRYIKKINDIVTEYYGPMMGDAWYAVNGWTAYSGSLAISRLDIADGAVVELPETPTAPRVISKLKLYDALTAAGLWEAFAAALENAGETERWAFAHDVSEDDAGFSALVAALTPVITAAGLDLDSLLDDCVMERY